MLTISGDYPALNPSTGGGAEVGSTAGVATGATGVIYSREAGGVLEIVATTPIAPESLTVDFVTVPIPPTIDTVSGVVLSGISLIPSQFEITDGAAKIPLTALPSAPIAGTTAVFYGLAGSYPVEVLPTDEVLHNLPGWLAQWNATGQFTVSREFASQPAASFEFVALSSFESSVRTELRPGRQLTFPALGMGFSVGSLQITRLPLAIYPDGLIQVSCSLTGYHVEALERKVKQGSAGASVASLAGATGVSYAGLAVPLNKSRDTPDASYTTLQSELEARALAAQGFVFYSSPASVGIVTWGNTQIHYLSTADLFSPIQITLNGRTVDDGAGGSGGSGGGSGGSGSPLTLTNELQNLGFEPDPIEEDIEQQQDVERWLEEADDFLSFPPDSIDSQSLKSTAQCFNNGGPTKERVRTLYKNGSILRQERDVWGLAYKSTQVHFITGDFVNGKYQRRWEYSPVSPASFWQKVEESVEVYNYDNLGYLTYIEKTGRKLAQFKQEQNNEALAAELISTVTSNGVVIQDATKLRALFNYFWLPYKDKTVYNLRSLVRAYPDIEISTEPDWVEPKYAAAVERKSFQQSVVENPVIDQSSQTKQPPIVVGQSRQELTRTTINYPPDNIRKEAYKSDYDQFAVSQTTQNSEGSGMKDSLKIGRRSENAGRPSTHTRLNRYNRRRTSRQGQGPFGFNPQITYIVNTPGSGFTENDPITGTISYEGAFTPEQGRLAAETQVSIDNTFGVEQWQFELNYNVAYQIKEGDRLMLSNTLLVVRSISHQYSIQGSLVTARSQVQAGKYLRPTVTLTQRKNANALAV